MRIIGGERRGLKLAEVGAGDAAAHLRPTSDRVREAIFNLLMNGPYGNPVENARVLDLFAGTGALGLEALSRGAARVTFIDDGATARALLRDNIDRMKAMGVTDLYRRDARSMGPNRGAPFTLVFLDPPYGQSLGEAALASAHAGGWIAPGLRWLNHRDFLWESRDSFRSRTLSRELFRRGPDLESAQLEFEPVVCDLEGIEGVAEVALARVEQRASEAIVAPLVHLVPGARPGGHVVDRASAGHGMDAEARVGTDLAVGGHEVVEGAGPVGRQPLGGDVLAALGDLLEGSSLDARRHGALADPLGDRPEAGLPDGLVEARGWRSGVHPDHR